MNKRKTMFWSAVLIAMSGTGLAWAQSGVDVLHRGYEITEAFSNRGGKDALSFYKISNVSTAGVDIAYSSTRGVIAKRRVQAVDRNNGRILSLGFSKKMPSILPGATTLGLSSLSLSELRNTGHTRLTLMTNSAMQTISGTLTLLAKEVKIPVLIGNQIVNLPTVHARGVFQRGKRLGVGNFYFWNNIKNPLTLQYAIKFNWEKTPRQVKITRIFAGGSQQANMEQTLRTVRSLELYGIRFDFGRASLKQETGSLIGDIATTLKNNPTWQLSIQGHTDSIGGAKANKRLSEKRAASVKNRLVNRYGINPTRLFTIGYGMARPKGPNTTLQGRALNRRVELVRIDR